MWYYGGLEETEVERGDKRYLALLVAEVLPQVFDRGEGVLCFRVSNIRRTMP